MFKSHRDTAAMALTLTMVSSVILFVLLSVFDLCLSLVSSSYLQERITGHAWLEQVCRDGLVILFL